MELPVNLNLKTHRWRAYLPGKVYSHDLCSSSFATHLPHNNNINIIIIIIIIIIGE
jgi:hypothetical protein